ncbi:unnamed protein product, partial [Symbiodinium pilosum]
MEYEILVPAGLLRDRLGNEVQAAKAGSFTTLSGVITTSDYFGGGMPGGPPPPGDEMVEGFPDLLATWPFRGARDVPPRNGIEIFLYFATPVEWSPLGRVQIFNETDLMFTIPTSDYVPGGPVRNLQVLPEHRAVKVRLPQPGGLPMLRPGRNFSLALSPGALQDMGLGNLSDAIRLEFKCLEMSQGNAMPRAIAADIAEGQEVPGSRHIFNIWYSEDIAKAVDQKPPVSLLLPSGAVSDLPGESQEVEIRGNRLTMTFPQH